MTAGEYQKSSFCNGASSCVEVCHLPNGNVALRDGKEQDGPVLVFTPREWAAFVAGVCDGEFDLASLASGTHGSDGEAPGRPPAKPLAGFGADSAPV
ncbi:DUF397 domain-containing protein [Nonomuraea sp. NPDC049269]|uniref:DUF397 domain-containing protein n=1 Tax=Nonomuraea sp. NPDC049269 TaxID=3364349 RepID=UPI00371058C9